MIMKFSFKTFVKIPPIALTLMQKLEIIVLFSHQNTLKQHEVCISQQYSFSIRLIALRKTRPHVELVDVPIHLQFKIFYPL